MELDEDEIDERDQRWCELRDIWITWVQEQQAALDRLDEVRAGHVAWVRRLDAPESLERVRERLLDVLTRVYDGRSGSLVRNVELIVAHAQSARSAVNTFESRHGDAGRAFAEGWLRLSEDLVERCVVCCKEMAKATERALRAIFPRTYLIDSAEQHRALAESFRSHVAATWHLVAALEANDEQMERDAIPGWELSLTTIVRHVNELRAAAGDEEPWAPATIDGLRSESLLALGPASTSPKSTS